MFPEMQIMAPYIIPCLNVVVSRYNLRIETTDLSPERSVLPVWKMGRIFHNWPT